MNIMFDENAKHYNMGQMIKNAVKERRMSVSDFAKAIYCSRTNVYSIFGRQSINIERLKQIADVLNLDISDFIVMKKGESNKCIAVIETEYEELERMSNEYNLACVKYWKMK